MLGRGPPQSGHRHDRLHHPASTTNAPGTNGPGARRPGHHRPGHLRPGHHRPGRHSPGHSGAGTTTTGGTRPGAGRLAACVVHLLPGSSTPAGVGSGGGPNGTGSTTAGTGSTARPATEAGPAPARRSRYRLDRHRSPQLRLRLRPDYGQLDGLNHSASTTAGSISSASTTLAPPSATPYTWQRDPSMNLQLGGDTTTTLAGTVPPGERASGS